MVCFCSFALEVIWIYFCIVFESVYHSFFSYSTKKKYQKMKKWLLIHLQI